MKHRKGLSAGGPVLSSPRQGREILRLGLNVLHNLGWEGPLRAPRMAAVDEVRLGSPLPQPAKESQQSPTGTFIQVKCHLFFPPRLGTLE